MKSDIVKQIAEERGLPIIDVKLSPADYSDFLGKPMNREIQIGDGVLMEYAEGVVELVLVQAIEDGVVYGEGDDGEPYCAPIANCDKVPF